MSWSRRLAPRWSPETVHRTHERPPCPTVAISRDFDRPSEPASRTRICPRQRPGGILPQGMHIGCPNCPEVVNLARVRLRGAKSRKEVGQWLGQGVPRCPDATGSCSGRAQEVPTRALECVHNLPTGHVVVDPPPAGPRSPLGI